MTDLPQLPKGWTWASLEALAAPEPNSITDGPFGSKLKTEHYRETGPRVVRLQNIGDGMFIDERAHISPEHFAALQRHCVFAGDIVIAALGETLPRACVIPTWLGAAIVKADCIRFKTHHALVNPRYAAHALNSPVTRAIAAKIIHGVGRPRMNQQEIKSLHIPVAPLAEQHRIVVELDKQFTRLDAGIEILKRALTHLNRYKASLLKAACEGRLVPTEAELARREKRDYESADKLLERILKERRACWEADQFAKMKTVGKLPKDDKWKAKYLNPVCPDPSGLPELPPGWRWASVDSILVEPPMNGLSMKESALQTEVRALRLSAMSERGFDYSDYRYLPMDWDDVSDLEVQAGDFFVSRGNGSLSLVGRGTAAQEPPFALIFPDTMIRLRLTPLIKSSGWLQAIWASRLVRHQIEKQVKTTAGIWKISQPELQALAIPLPPLVEQERIVRTLDRRMTHAGDLALLVAHELQRSTRLRQTILRHAFEGKLVAQDPHDEHAAALLERVRWTTFGDAGPVARKPRTARSRVST